jgi:hypothetical protein
LLILDVTYKLGFYKTNVLFSTAEKSYMVCFALYNYIAHKPYASHYMVALIGDSLMVIGGIWYL